MTYCYDKILNSESYTKSEIKQIKREDYYRARLCNFLHKYSEEYGLQNLVFEKDVEETDDFDLTIGFLDIKVINVVLDLKENENGEIMIKSNPYIYFTFECKRLDLSSNDEHYIKTGIYEFINGKYSRNMDYAGMIGFIEKGDPNTIVNKINQSLKKYTNIVTTQKMSKYDVNGFKHGYFSKHERDGSLSDISLYHLMFDYTTIFH